MERRPLASPLSEELAKRLAKSEEMVGIGEKRKANLACCSSFQKFSFPWSMQISPLLPSLLPRMV
jgi:hypothetical protein